MPSISYSTGSSADEQFRVDGIDLSQAGIQRGRFSGASRAGDDENAVWFLDYLENVVVDIIGHAEIFEIEIGARSIQHPQHHAFAEGCRECGHAKVDRVAVDDP